MSGKDGIDKLSGLLGKTGSTPTQAVSAEAPKQLSEEQITAEIDALLKYVAGRTGGDIFAMQDLIEAGADELRIQIRDEIENGGD